MEGADDDTLVAAIGGGDRAALGVLYDRHSQVLFALAMHVVGERQRAEDLIHDAFLDLARAARARNLPTHVLRWLVLRVFELAR